MLRSLTPSALASGECARGFVEEDFVAARCGQCVVLALGVLIAGGHSAVPDTHASLYPMRMHLSELRYSDFTWHLV